MGLVATRRWCATVRRGRHTKSTRGYSGHVTATQEEEEEEEEEVSRRGRATSVFLQRPCFTRFRSPVLHRVGERVLIGLRGDTH